MTQNSGILKVIPVCTHVTIEVTTLGKTCITDLALVRFFPSVGAKMLRQSGAVGKSLAAHIALVRAIPRVSTHVSGNRTALRETTIADGTLEWFLTAVRPQVRCEVCSLGERLLTYGALVWFLTRVGSEVCFQCRLPCISLATHVTRVISGEDFISTRGKLRKIT